MFCWNKAWPAHCQALSLVTAAAVHWRHVVVAVAAHAAMVPVSVVLAVLLVVLVVVLVPEAASYGPDYWMPRIPPARMADVWRISERL